MKTKARTRGRENDLYRPCTNLYLWFNIAGMCQFNFSSALRQWQRTIWAQARRANTLFMSANFRVNVLIQFIFLCIFYLTMFSNNNFDNFFISY